MCVDSECMVFIEVQFKKIEEMSQKQISNSSCNPYPERTKVFEKSMYSISLHFKQRKFFLDAMKKLKYLGILSCTFISIFKNKTGKTLEVTDGSFLCYFHLLWYQKSSVMANGFGLYIHKNKMIIILINFCIFLL